MKKLNRVAMTLVAATLATAAGAQEPQSLLGYLHLLDTDATVREAHAKDPVASMTQYGLGCVEQSAALSGDTTVIAKSAGLDVGRKVFATQITNGEYGAPI